MYSTYTIAKFWLELLNGHISTMCLGMLGFVVYISLKWRSSARKKFPETILDWCYIAGLIGIW